MNKAELAAKSVLELRAVAKEYKVKLSAGIKKAEILERLYSVACADDSDEMFGKQDIPDEVCADKVVPEQTEKDEETKADEESSVDDNAEETAEAVIHDIASAEAEAANQQNSVTSSESGDLPRSPYQKAYHNPLPAPIRRFNNAARNGFGQSSGGFGPRSSQRPPVSHPGLLQPEHPNAPRTVSRFGPPVATEVTVETVRRDPVPVSEQQSSEQSPVFSVPVSTERPAVPAASEIKPAERPVAPAVDSRTADRQNLPSISSAELLTVNELREGSGYLELHPEGYGFLRPATLTATSNDVYVSTPQIKRFGLRNGDYITGRLRPMRESDRCGFLLTV